MFAFVLLSLRAGIE